MKIEELTIENVTPVIKALVSEYGEDYIYKAEDRGYPGSVVRCYYQEDGKPSCIVGHILDRMDVKYDPEWERRNASAILGGAPEELRHALVGAQGLQDAGRTWGKALNEFLARAES